MVDQVLSPDGKMIWSEDEEVPEYLKSKWVDIEKWTEWLSNTRKCPLCHWLLDLEPDEKYADCRHCNAWFKIIENNPLTLEHQRGTLNKYHLPIEFVHKLLDEEGLIFYARDTSSEEGPDGDSMIDGINKSMNEIRDSISEIVQEAVDDLSGDPKGRHVWYDVYNEYEIVEEEEENQTYVIDEEE